MTVYLIRGLIGPKKMELINKIGAVTISEDQYFTVDGNYHFDKSKAAEAKKYCEIMLDVLLSKCHIDVIINNTFVMKSWMKSYFDIANKNGATVKVITSNDDTTTIKYTPQSVIDWIKLNFEE